MSAAWFKPKRYGIGATPVSWQGWAVTLCAFALIAGGGLVLLAPFDAAEPQAGRVILFVVLAACVAAVLSLVAWRTTEGPWRWRWGRD
jgi:hypothetical protein